MKGDGMRKKTFTTQIGRQGRVALPPSNFLVGQRVFVTVAEGGLMITARPRPFSQAPRISVRIRRVNARVKPTRPIFKFRHDGGRHDTAGQL